MHCMGGQRGRLSKLKAGQTWQKETMSSTLLAREQPWHFAAWAGSPSGNFQWHPQVRRAGTRWHRSSLLPHCSRTTGVLRTEHKAPGEDGRESGKIQSKLRWPEPGCRASTSGQTLKASPGTEHAPSPAGTFLAMLDPAAGTCCRCNSGWWHCSRSGLGPRTALRQMH